MLLVLCVDLDDDLGRKTDVATPVIGRDAVVDAAVELASVDPEDSDVNVLFEGVHIVDRIDDEPVEVVAVTGIDGGDVAANRAVGEEIDTVLASLTASEDVRALIVTDGAQDESVLPVIRARIRIDGVRRVVVRQAQDLESIYYTIKQVLNDPETRGTILVPLGILLLIYPMVILVESLGYPGSAFGIISGLFGIYVLGRGLGAKQRIDNIVSRATSGFYGGRITIITYVVAAALLAIGGVSGVNTLDTQPEQVSAVEVLSALVNGAIQWFTAAGVTSSLGRVTDEYLNGTFEWRYLNAPVYMIAIGGVLNGLSAFFLGIADLEYLAMTLTGGTLLGLASTLALAVAQSRHEAATGSTPSGPPSE
jgi:putative membrane protein